MRIALAEKSIARKKGTYLNNRSARRARAGAASPMHRRIQVSSAYPPDGFSPPGLLASALEGSPLTDGSRLTNQRDDRSHPDHNQRRLNFSAWDPPATNAPAMGSATISKSAKRALRFRPLFLGALAVFLVWEVITRSLVAYLADTYPKAAIHLRSTDSTALLNLAQDKLNGAMARNAANPAAASDRDEASPPTAHPDNGENSVANSRNSDPIDPFPDLSPDEFAEIRDEAELALLNDPINARALGILGRLSERDSDEERTKTLMQAAARRSLLESRAVYWMMRKSYQQRDYRAAMRYADALLRTRPEIAQLGVATLAKLAENPDSNGELKKLLLTNPPWRPKFFEFLPTSVSDARTPLDILLSLKDSQVPPTADDLRFYLKFPRSPRIP